MSAPRRDQAADELDAWVAEQLARAPRLTDSQRAKVTALLGGGAR